MTDTERFFIQVIEIIDVYYGDGYAKKNPQLVASLLQVRLTEEYSPEYPLVR